VAKNSLFFEIVFCSEDINTDVLGSAPATYQLPLIRKFLQAKTRLKY